jgi:hypothetical protein
MEQRATVNWYPPLPEVAADESIVNHLQTADERRAYLAAHPDQAVNYPVPDRDAFVLTGKVPERVPREAIPAQPARLVISGELLPQHEVVHHMIASLFDDQDPPKVDVEFSNFGNVLHYTLTFSSPKDILGIASVETRAHKVAQDQRIPLNLARDRVIEQTKREGDAEKVRKDQEAKTRREPMRVSVQAEHPGSGRESYAEMQRRVEGEQMAGQQYSPEAAAAIARSQGALTPEEKARAEASTLTTVESTIIEPNRPFQE